MKWKTVAGQLEVVFFLLATYIDCYLCSETRYRRLIEGNSLHPHRYHFRHTRICFAMQFLTQEIHRLGVNDRDYRSKI